MDYLVNQNNKITVVIPAYNVELILLTTFNPALEFINKIINRDNNII